MHVGTGFSENTGSSVCTKQKYSRAVGISFILNQYVNSLVYIAYNLYVCLTIPLSYCSV